MDIEWDIQEYIHDSPHPNQASPFHDIKVGIHEQETFSVTFDAQCGLRGKESPGLKRCLTNLEFLSSLS